MIVIVGAGISGLALAHGLRERGAPTLVLEAAPRVGGTVRTTARQGFVTEWGPNAFLDREPATRALTAALGLTDRIRVAEPSAHRRLVFHRGALREVPSSPLAFLRSDLLSLPGRLRVVAEVLSRRGEEPDEPLASFARRHLGREAADVLIDALQTGTYAGDFERLSAASAFPQLKELERDHRSLILGMIRLQRARKATRATPPGTLSTFEGGLETLVATLGQRLHESIHTGARTTAVARGGDGWKLTVLMRGAASTVEAKTVVLAVPAFAAAELVRSLDAPLATALDEIEYAAVSVVHLGFLRAELPARPQGFGFIVPASQGRPLLGTIYVSSIFPWRAPGEAELFTCLVGGARRGDLIALADDELLTAVREQLRALLGITAQPRHQEIVRWPRGIPQYNVGHAARLGRIDAAVARHPGLHLTGNAYRGVGLNDCIRNAAALADRLLA